MPLKALGGRAALGVFHSTQWPGFLKHGPPLGIALVFLVAHLFFLAPTPASIDGVNFVLGVRDFDVNDHRPHPPGSPLFIALGKTSHLFFGSHVQEPLARLSIETRALAVWSAILGSLSVLPLLAIFRRLGRNERRAWAATLLTLALPLFWMLAIRPLSDLAGLTLALFVQALLLSSLRDDAEAVPREARGSFRLGRSAGIAAALLAGLAVGIRSQTLWLTVPLITVGVRRLWREDRALVGAMAVAFSIGVLLWALPLLIATRGLERYLQAFAGQAAEQWHDEGILAASPTPAHFGRALMATLASPFADQRVAVVAAGVGLLGLVVKVFRAREGLKWMAVLYGPYLLFHLLFQDPNDARYALPIAPALAYLIVCGFDVATSRLMPWLVAALIAVCLSIAVPPVIVYGQTGNPVFRALGDVQARAQNREAAGRPVLAMHYAVARMLRGQSTALQTLPSTPKKEWRALVNYWRRGGSAPVWFLAERGRTDLALIDKASRRIVKSYTWPFENRNLMTSAKPRGLLWYELRPPGWMADEGWALTPETGGVAFADRRGPSEQPVHAFIRRRPDALALLIGGRSFATPGDPAPRIAVRIDGVLVDSWVEENSAFLRTWHLAAGSLNGSGPYATLEVFANRATSRGPRPRVVIDQFDAQPDGSLLYGFDSGWYELELDPRTGESWRWTERVASLRILSGRDLIVHLSADRLPGKVRRAPQIVVRAGDKILDSQVTDSGTVLKVAFRVPSTDLARADGVVTIQTVAPTAEVEALDPNRPFPGLRVFDLTIEPAEASS